MRKIIVSLLATGAMVLGTQAWSLPASAAGNCPAAWICFYDTSVNTYPLEKRDGADWGPGECYQMPSSANNKTSYVWNRTAGTWKVHNITCAGDLGGTIYPNTGASMGSVYNNTISAYNHA